MRPECGCCVPCGGFSSRAGSVKQLHTDPVSPFPVSPDTRNFARAHKRRLSAEVLLDAVGDLTGIRDTFQGLPPNSRAVQTWNHKLSSEFLDAFGRPNASQECPCERERKSSVVQALHLMNSDTLQNKLASEKGRVTALVKDASLLRAKARHRDLSRRLQPPARSRGNAGRPALLLHPRRHPPDRRRRPRLGAHQQRRIRLQPLTRRGGSGHCPTLLGCSRKPGCLA
ncbi:MAG TPA: hypothetical protein DIT64_13550 [Verrucomicrobiales bacterium]|nr:hypothetical protein [Verrucomicrobiales bacterium]